MTIEQDLRIEEIANKLDEMGKKMMAETHQEHPLKEETPLPTRVLAIELELAKWREMLFNTTPTGRETPSRLGKSLRSRWMEQRGSK